jgi:hypothetical protein
VRIVSVKFVFVIAVAIFLLPVISAGLIALFRAVEVWFFNRVLKRFASLDEQARSRAAQRIRHVQQLLALKDFLQSRNVPTPLKVEICQLLMSLEKFTFMPSDYLVRLMVEVEEPYQRSVATLALQYAAEDRNALAALLNSLERINDFGLTELILEGIASIAATVPEGQRGNAGALPSEFDRAAVTKQIALTLGHCDEGIRRTAANLLRSIFAANMADAENTLMVLLRDRRSEVKDLAAELVLDHQDQLKAAICCARAIRADLSPKLRQRI